LAQRAVHLVFDVDELAMDAEGTEDAEGVRGVEHVVEQVVEGGDVIVAHATREEEEGQPNWDHCREVHQREEAERQVRDREGGGGGDLKKNSDLWSAMKRLRHQSKAKRAARQSSRYEKIFKIL
jgi:hypothetical protein